MFTKYVISWEHVGRLFYFVKILFNVSVERLEIKLNKYQVPFIFYMVFDFAHTL